MAFCLHVKSLNLHICNCQAHWNVELRYVSLYHLGRDWSENDTNSDSFVLNLSCDWPKNVGWPCLKSMHCNCHQIKTLCTSKK